MENFVVSARKYRPITFDTVVGQSSITNTLKNAIRNNTLAQAFLFCGPRGVGKTTCARIMAKTINCLHPTENLEACNECESCRAFNNNASFNIYELDAASNNSVDDIRSLVDQVRIPPQIGDYKVYIIDEVHMLSKDAFNAFLKTLEEPPAYAKFILATTEKHKIIPTILSRCQIYDFKRITVDDIAKHLAYVASSEGVNAEPEALNIIAQKADGALRDALSIFDQMVSFSGKTITYKDVIDNLNVLDYDYYFRVVDDILQGNTSDILMLINEIVTKGFEPHHFINGLGTHLRSLLVSKDAVTTELLEVSEQLRQRYIQQSQVCQMSFLIKALDINDKCDIDYRSANNKRLHLEIALLKMCALCTQGLNMPQPQVQPTQLPQNKPAAPQPARSTATPAAAEPARSTAAPATSNPSPITNNPSPATPGPSTPSTPLRDLNPTPAPSTSATTTTPVTNNPSPITHNPSPVTNNPSPTTPTPETPPAVRPRGVTRSASINEVLKQAEAKADDTEEVINTPFSQEQLEMAWNEFTHNYKVISPNFAAGLSKYIPKVGPNFEIHFSVDNKLFETDADGMNALKTHLKNRLRNNQFKLIPEVMEKPAEVDVYTDKDKFERMAKENPLLKSLQTELNLEGDL